MKSGSFVECPRCGFMPINLNDVAISLALNEAEISSSFNEISKEISLGSEPPISSDQVRNFHNAAAETIRMLGFDQDHYVVKDDLESLVCSATDKAIDAVADAFEISPPSIQPENTGVLLFWCFLGFEQFVLKTIPDVEPQRSTWAQYVEKAFPYRATFITLNSGCRDLFFDSDLTMISKRLPEDYRQYREYVTSVHEKEIFSVAATAQGAGMQLGRQGHAELAEFLEGIHSKIFSDGKF
jgi:hypothetical protein